MDVFYVLFSLEVAAALFVVILLLPVAAVAVAVAGLHNVALAHKFVLWRRAVVGCWIGDVFLVVTVAEMEKMMALMLIEAQACFSKYYG